MQKRYNVSSEKHFIDLHAPVAARDRDRHVDEADRDHRRDGGEEARARSEHGLELVERVPQPNEQRTLGGQAVGALGRRLTI